LKYKIVLTVAIIAILAGTLIFYIPFKEKEEEVKILNISAAAREFNADNALTFSREICKLGPRYGGNNAELKAADIMEKKIRRKWYKSP